MAVIQRILVGVAAACLVTACNHGEGGGGGGPAAPPVVGQAPADADLAFFGIHYHQDYYGNPRYYGVDWSVSNDSAWNPGTVAWSIRRVETGKVLRGTVPVGANAAIGDGHNVHVEIFAAAQGDPSWIEPGRHTLVVTIDPDNVSGESADNRVNNTHTLVVDVPSEPRPQVSNDLRFFAREAHVHEAQPGNRFTFHFTAENTGLVPIVGATWRLRSSDTAVPAPFALPPIPPGGTVESSSGITIARPGTYVVEMVLDPDDAIGSDRDADAGNNVRRFTIVVPNTGAPVGNG